jgi:small subunit ribosomal protein S6
MAEPEIARLKEYETIYVLKGDVATEAAQRVAERVGEVVAREKGRLTLVENWGRRQLSYRVARYKRGVYVYVRFLGNGLLVNEMERNLRMFDDVLKYQTVKVRDEVELDAVTVDPDRIKFEDVLPPAEDEDEQTLEQELGLMASDREREREEGAERKASKSEGDSEDGDSDEEPQEEEEA